MNIKKLLFLTMYFIAVNSIASPLSGADTVSEYLMISTEQQEIPLRRYLEANKDIVNICYPGWSLNQSNNYFLSWVNDNPQYVRRNLTSAFSDALFDACRELKNKQSTKQEN